MKNFFVPKNITNRLNVFQTFLLSYGLLLIVVSIMFFSIYAKVFQIVSEQIRYNNLTQVQQGSEILDARLQEIDRMAVWMKQDPNFNALASQTEITNNSYYSLWELKTTLNFLGTANDYAKNIWAVFPATHQIVSPTYGSFLLENSSPDNQFSLYDMQNTLFNALENYSPESRAFPTAEDLWGNTISSKDTITYIVPIPYATKMDNIGYLVLMIEEAELIDLMPTLDDSGSFMGIYTADQIQLAANKQNFQPDFDKMMDSSGVFSQYYDNQEYVVSYIVSSKNDWIYCMATPNEYIADRVDVVIQTFLVLILMFLIIGVFLVVFLAYTTSHPIKKMALSIRKLLPESSYGTTNELLYINNSFSELLDKNQSLSKSLEQQKPFLKMALLNNLITGNFIDSDEMYAYMNAVGFHLSHKKFVVAIARISITYDPADENAIQRKTLINSTIIEFLETRSGLPIHSLTYGKNDLVLIFEQPESEDNPKIRSNTTDFLKSLLAEIEQNYKIVIHFVCGQLCSQPQDIYVSFNQVEDYLNENELPAQNGVIWYEELFNHDNSYFLPEYVQKKLRNIIKAGNTQDCKNTLDMLYTENYINRKIQQVEHECFLADLYSCFIHSSSSRSNHFLFTPEQQAYLYELSTMKPQDGYRSLYQKILAYCDKVQTEKKKKNMDTANELIQYVDQHFCDASLSLQSMGEHFNLNEVYISSFFKKHVGENFSTYVDKKRIQRAIELLSTTDLSNSAIASEVGYNNAISLRRSFKRVLGILPSEYLQQGPSEK